VADPWKKKRGKYRARAIGDVTAPKNPGETMRARFAAIDGVELELPSGPMREPPSFSGATRLSCSTPSAHAFGRIDYLQGRRRARSARDAASRASSRKTAA
jgi:hypothetical protein